jgi:hypothetical protein
MRVESIARGQEFSAFSGHQGESAMGHSHSTSQPRFRASFAAAAILLAALAPLGAAHAQGLDLRGAENPNVWRPTSAANAFAGLSLAPAPLSPNSLHLFSDYYFIDPARTDLSPKMTSLFGGFRASTGFTGPSQPLSLFDRSPEASQALPYLGLGYSHLWLNNTLSVKADLGLSSQNPWVASHLRGTPTPTLDDVTRDLRWAPVMAVNLSYSF